MGNELRQVRQLAKTNYKLNYFIAMTLTRKSVLLLAVGVLAMGFTSGLLGALMIGRGSGNLSSKSVATTPASQATIRSNTWLPQNGEVSSFSEAAERGKASVVFIKTLTEAPRRRQDDFWSFFDFYGNRGPIASAGSGVILTEDGYIVTNNHVVERADQIEVSLPNKHTYKATVVGTDPRTDLAVLKVEATALTPISLSNSDSVRIGDWVLAVGNPFNLTYTVTAGIISAKGRNINIVNDQFPIESFIQTDAAINPGNSGGALINLQGQLIGINTAIASRTGYYTGYGFAIPSNIVRKVVDDLRVHGSVQQAFLGADVIDIDNSIGEKLGLEDYSGVYVESVLAESAAAKAGLEKEDVIIAIGETMVDTKATFLELISLYRPGDKVEVRIRRGAQQKTLKLVMQNEEGTTAILKDRTVRSEELGADIKPLSKLEQQTLGVPKGYRLMNIRSGRIAQMGLAEGFVLLSLNGYVPETVDELVKLINGARGRIVIEGISPDGSRAKYSFYSY